jgi:hypothetical protein
VLDRARLGAPGIRLEGLEIWVHGRQFPGADDYWEGNWLNATAHCGAACASVLVTGPFVRLPEIDQWVVETRELLKNLSGKANLRAWSRLSRAP